MTEDGALLQALRVAEARVSQARSALVATAEALARHERITGELDARLDAAEAALREVERRLDGVAAHGDDAGVIDGLRGAVRDTARARARHRGHGDALARAHADAREALRVEAAKHEAIAGRVEAARREAARRRAARDEP